MNTWLFIVLVLFLLCLARSVYFRLFCLDLIVSITERRNRKKRRRVRILLVRHGESNANVCPDRIGGRSNFSGLTIEGRRQAYCLSYRLGKLVKANEITEAYSSSSVRARETGLIALRESEYKGELIESDDLLELSMGSWTGMKREYVYTKKVLDRISKCGLFHRSPGYDSEGTRGESMYDVEKRMSGFIDKLLLRGEGLKDGATIVIFTHGIAIRCFLRRILGGGPLAGLHIKLDNTSVTELEYRPSARGNYDSDLSGWHVLGVNDTSHLSRRR